MNRTSVVLDDELAAECQRATGIGTKRALIHHALEELLRHNDQRSIPELKGKVAWEGGLASWREQRRHGA